MSSPSLIVLLLPKLGVDLDSEVSEDVRGGCVDALKEPCEYSAVAGWSLGGASGG